MAKIKTLKEIYKDTPEMISGAVEMKSANIPIPIYKGNFILKRDDLEIKIIGKIIYEWLPESGSKFYGRTKVNAKKLIIAFQSFDTFQLIINKLNFGDCLLSTFSLGSQNNSTLLSGTLSNQAALGDKSVPVSIVKFSVPNLREFHGGVIKRSRANGISSSSGRIIFENKIYTIIIDKCYKYSDLQKSLDAKGGFIVQYVGELKKRKGNILFEDSKEIVHCFDTFLSFLNGRRTAIMFLKGCFEEKAFWSDYTDYIVDRNKWTFSWTRRRSIEGLNELWNKFSQLWENENNKDFLKSVIHWYVEANSGSPFPEGSIIMAQTGLELIYNWLLIEQNKILIGNDAENISTANKIRLLLSYLNVSTEIPKSFIHLKMVPDAIDGPDAFVQIRNAIVHSQEVKRKKLTALNVHAKSEALQLGIWYIELALLKILDYNGFYSNRSLRNITTNREQLVPWAKVGDK